MDQIEGMALVPSARDVHKYMFTNGNEPELQDDVPVWVIQLKGIVVSRYTSFNPVCVVKANISYVFAPYGGVARDGTWYGPPDIPGFIPRQFSLPPLGP